MPWLSVWRFMPLNGSDSSRFVNQKMTDLREAMLWRRPRFRDNFRSNQFFFWSLLRAQVRFRTLVWRDQVLDKTMLVLLMFRVKGLSPLFRRILAGVSVPRAKIKTVCYGISGYIRHFLLLGFRLEYCRLSSNCPVAQIDLYMFHVHILKLGISET